MAVGKPITKASMDSLSASYARNFTGLLNDEAFAEYAQSVLSLNTAGLEALGYTTAEANTIVAFVNTMNGHIADYNRDEPDPTPKGGRFFARQLYGVYNG